jgi:hypothetical protein
MIHFITTAVKTSTPTILHLPSGEIQDSHDDEYGVLGGDVT